MGGEHEGIVGVQEVDLGGTLEPEGVQPATDEIQKIPPLAQSLRYHVKDGYVHFHLDPEKLRVSIPVAEWWSALESLKNLRVETWRYIDHEAGTMLEVQAGLNEKNEFDLSPTVKKISTGSGSIFQKLNEFTVKARKKK